MTGYGYTPFGWLGWIFMLVFWALIIAGVVILAKRLIKPEEKKSDSAMEILRKRYAKGEINKEEFERIKKDLK
ncbi:SHOCT domain-containing protein [Patescibacteria group bacterium]|nr:SHOCT domain-containing protein [Patescibacteria group bacterium]